MWYNAYLFGLVPVWLLMVAIASSLGSFGGLKYYYVLRMRKRRYREKIDFKKLPKPGQRSAYIGKVAETSVKAYFELDRLQTHTIVAGATGSGKTVVAQDIVEEFLMKGGSVLVFDPTAQWTGFMRKCEDNRMLSRYDQFDMKTGDAKPFKGGIRIIEDPHELISLKKHMNPGEITVFVINKLTTREIDIFVVNTIEQVFRANLEESSKMKTLLVYDEVHRLLTKFGGSGRGFIQIERGCREFRKWGVGMLLVSQVLSDFVGEIKANIGTEIQMRTWYEGDLERIKMKYGEDISQSVVKGGIGTGMVVNSEYNMGRPYFLSFRPVYHSPTRLSDNDLSIYNKYNGIIDNMQFQVDELRKRRADVFDIEIELKLARDKVREGSFSMVDIYLESLRPRIKLKWDNIERPPEKPEKQYVSKTVLEKSVEKAEKARETFVKKEKMNAPFPEKARPKLQGEEKAVMRDLVDSFTKLNMLFTTAKGAGKKVAGFEKEIKAIKPSIEMLMITEDAAEIKKVKEEIENLIKMIKTK
jgi:hypothetical protein